MKINYKEMVNSIAITILGGLSVIVFSNLVPDTHGFLIFLILLLAAFAFGSMYGSEVASAIIAIYLVANILGFAKFMDGQIGMSSFSSPLGGYKIGFLLVAFMTGVLIPPGKDYNPGTLLLAFVGTGSLLHFVGIPWLVSHSSLQPGTVVMTYFIPLLLPHIIATIAILATYKSINKLTIS